MRCYPYRYDTLPQSSQIFDGEARFCHIFNFNEEALRWLSGSHWRRNAAEFQWSIFIYDFFNGASPLPSLVCCKAANLWNYVVCGSVRLLPCCISIWMRKSWFWFSYIDLNCVGWMSWFWCWWICIFHGLFPWWWWSVRYTIPGSHRQLWGVFVFTSRRCLLSLHGLTRELLAVHISWK